MKKIICGIMVCSSIGGCAWDSAAPYSTKGWNSLYPPQANALGASVIDVNGNDLLGDRIKYVTPNQVEYNDSVLKYSQTDVNNFKAGLDVAVKGIAAGMSYETDGTTTKVGDNLRIMKVKDVVMVNDENKWFVYQCIVASSYEFTAKKKSALNIGVDASKAEWAKALGMDKASIGISSKPAAPDEMKITVANPNVCLGYLAAKFVPYVAWLKSNRPKTKYITFETSDGKSLTNFPLGVGGETLESTADIKSQIESSRTLYRLKVEKEAVTGALRIKVCKQKRGLGSIDDTQSNSLEVDCSQTLSEWSPGRWRGPQIIGIAKPNDYKLALVTLNLDARVVANDSVEFTEPRIKVFEYEIKYK